VLGRDLLEQLAQHFRLIKQPVELAASLDDSAKSAQLQAFLAEVAGLSDLITVTAERDERRPSFAVARAGTDVRVRFAAIPLGHELTSFVLAVLQVGGHPPTAKPEVIERVKRLTGEYHFTTYLSLSCQNCPEVVQALNLMSVLNPKITHVAVDGAIFKAEAEALNVLAVPSVFLNGAEFGAGRMGLEQILDRLGASQKEEDSASEEPALAAVAKPVFDVLVVGAGPAGVSAAIYAARKGLSTGLVGDRVGGQVLDTMAIENLISVPYTEGPKLATALEQHAQQHEIDLMTPRTAVRLVPAGDPDAPHEVELDNGAALRARTVVIASGARWRTLDVPGEAEYRNHGVTYCPHCDGPLFKGRRVAVIGGGNSGVESAIDLAGVAAHVTLLEFGGSLNADEVLQRKLRSLKNADVIVNAKTTEVTGDGAKVTGLAYTDRVTGEASSLALDGVFVQIGLLPSTGWLAGTPGIELNRLGELVVDERGATAVPGVFGAGDCTTTAYKQIVTAMGGGSTAALSAFNHLIRSAPVAIAS
jgi:NADH-dependent peroxiredoxin subunit F